MSALGCPRPPPGVARGEPPSRAAGGRTIGPRPESRDAPSGLDSPAPGRFPGAALGPEPRDGGAGVAFGEALRGTAAEPRPGALRDGPAMPAFGALPRGAGAAFGPPPRGAAGAALMPPPREGAAGAARGPGAGVARAPPPRGAEGAARAPPPPPRGAEGAARTPPPPPRGAEGAARAPPPPPPMPRAAPLPPPPGRAAGRGHASAPNATAATRAANARVLAMRLGRICISLRSGRKNDRR